MTSDEELMQQFQRGSREAFEVLFSRYRSVLFGFFFRRLHNSSRADDLTQETFIAVIRSVAKWKPQASTRAYRFSIAVRIVAAERRKQKREFDDRAPEAKDPSEAELVFAVRHALGKLETGEREILMLREYEQLSYAEIAQALQIPVNTVRSRLFRARMALKDVFEPAKREACN